MGAHTALYKATGGRLGHKIPGVPGKMLLLDHKGAKSGTERTSPLLYFRDAWYHNLKANPDTTVQVASHHLPVRARVATPEERERLWPLAVKSYHGYEDYARRSKGREIPLVILEPRK